MTTTNEQHPVKIKNFERDLLVNLSQGEIVERSQRMTRLMDEVRRKKEELDALKKHTNGQIDEIEAQVRRLADEVRDSVTSRRVECQERTNYRVGTVGEYRMDRGGEAGELLPGTERPLTDKERQLENGLKEPLKAATPIDDAKTNGKAKAEAAVDSKKLEGNGADDAVVEDGYKPGSDEPPPIGVGESYEPDGRDFSPNEPQPKYTNPPLATQKRKTSGGSGGGKPKSGGKGGGGKNGSSKRK